MIDKVPSSDVGVHAAQLNREASRFNMIDHFNLPVSDLEASRHFYELALAPLGLTFLMKDGDAVGFGVDTWVFGIVAATSPLPQLHLAFRARSREVVDQFFQAALIAGGRSNGSPGIRAAYDPSYYAAFVLDPDGHNIEAVCRHAAIPNISLERTHEK